ncbi:MAG: Fpg/Nei family DNA glycosylase [Fimbriimonadaceae bacterium]
MPEFPDIELYRLRLQERLVGERLIGARFFSAFVLRSVGVAASDVENRSVVGVSRMGKRLVLEFEDERFILLHLMVAGRLQWVAPAPPATKGSGKVLLASFRFTSGQLNLVEFSTRKRASIHLIHSRTSLEEHRRGGIDVLTAAPIQFAKQIQAQNRTLKRILTDPNSFDGIGNAYSDEILFAAKLSPLRLTSSLSDAEIARLHEAARTTFTQWAEKLQALYPEFPKPSDITAFRPDFATHGRYGKPCPVCASPIQRIVYAENETNYCARCQNEGRILADRSLSRLLKADWPKTLEEMEGAGL